MNQAPQIDAARLTLLLNELRLPTIKAVWKQFAEEADQQDWSGAKLLIVLAEHEVAERSRRRIERHLAQACLPPGKTLEGFEFTAAPTPSCSARLGWQKPSGCRHWSGLVENGYRVLYTCTTDLVQRLQVARRDLSLEAAIDKLDKYQLLILDDTAYVTKDQAETSVLFELISARYERRSLLITLNQSFGEWGRIFPDPVMTLAAVDRLVHHATIFELNVESFRRRTALDEKSSRGRPATKATIKTTQSVSLRDTDSEDDNQAINTTE